LIISVAGIAIKYNVYLHENAIELRFQSTDRSRVELAALLLRLAGVNAEVKKVGNRDVWQVRVYTDALASGREVLRKALAEIVKEARKSVGEEKAERLLKKLEKGRVLIEEWPKFHVGLTNSGGLVVRYRSIDRNSIEQVAQRLREVGLEEGRHFTVKMPDGDKEGYVSILKLGLLRAARLSVRGKDEKQRKLADDFIKHILQRAEEACGGVEQCPVYEKVLKIIEEGRARGVLKLERFEKEVEVNGKKYVVKVIGGGAELEEGRSGKTLLRIKIKAEVICVGNGCIVDRVVREYTITFGRYGKINMAMGFAMARSDAPGGRETDAERLAAVIKALTDIETRIRWRSDSAMITCYEGHLEGFMRYEELVDVIEEWLDETRR
jgi:hypothetical protein